MRVIHVFGSESEEGSTPNYSSSFDCTYLKVSYCCSHECYHLQDCNRMSASSFEVTCSVVMQVCYYRDKNSINKFQTAIVTKAGVKISDPFSLDTEWSYKVSKMWHERHCMSRACLT